MKKNLKYSNITIFLSVIFVTALFFYTGTLQVWVSELERFGYFGALLAGIFFVSTFSVIPASAVLILLSQDLNVFGVALLAGVGAMLGDYVIFKFVKDDLTSELRALFHEVAGDNILKFRKVIHTKYFAWLGPVIGAIVIASPFPDELGVGLLGIYKLDNKKFALLSFVLNFVGILFLLSAIKVVF